MSDPQKSRQDELEIPEFKSTIPAHLLGKLSDSERYMVETMSKLENQSQWLIDLTIKSRQNTSDVDLKVQGIEDWKTQAGKKLETVEPMVLSTKEKVDKLWDWHQMLSGKWAIIWALMLVVSPIVLKFIFDLVASAIKKGP